MISQAEHARVERFGGAIPRYTSYPTAPHFDRAVTAEGYGRMLGALSADDRLSLYAHIPFCGSLCWFCACRSQGVRSYRPVALYLEGLLQEIAVVAERTKAQAVSQIHLGGGSPTILDPADIVRLGDALRAAFRVEPTAEIAVEIDARDMTEARLDALAAAGVTRASLGVQDFNEEVQIAINRIQSFETTRAIAGGLRNRGVRSINIDALYGLPYQTVDLLVETVEKILAIGPDRIALFGYAHVPWMAKRQKLIPDSALPDAATRYEMAQIAGCRLVEAGYARIGLDHFARPDDTLAQAAAEGRLRRNFQGYTVDPATALLGFGASAIGRTPLGYVQNASATPAYLATVSEGALATERGLWFTEDDIVRGDAIERLMCDMRFDAAASIAKFGAAADPVLDAAAEICARFPGDMVRAGDNGFAVTELGRPFLRNIAAEFDAYLGGASARYSRAV